MSELNYADCIGCGLCILGCPAYEETGFDMLTARGRNKGLQAGLDAPELVESIWACTLCGYCDAICPSDVHNVDIVLHLRRELAMSEASSRVERLAPVSEALVLGCTIRERAPYLIASIREFLSRIGRSSHESSEACCGSLDVEAGRTLRVKVKAGVVADPICLEQYDAEFLGVLAMQHLELFDLEPPFYYYAPHRLINRDHALMYPLYDSLRRRFGCDMNFDLNRLARSTSAGRRWGTTCRSSSSGSSWTHAGPPRGSEASGRSRRARQARACGTFFATPRQ